MPRISLAELNRLDRHQFVRICGSFVEHSSWIAELAWEDRPFKDLDSLHQAFARQVAAADASRQMAIIQAHPDLVGHLARLGKITDASKKEQASAGLADLAPAEISLFDQYNAQYHTRFGFPFIICARENKKDAILRAFPIRLAHGRDEEINTALHEIAKIAKFRIADAIAESSA